MVCLVVPDNSRVYALPLSAFPDTFSDDLEGYLRHLAGHDLFAATARRPMSPTTLRDRKIQLLELASALVHSGREPASIRTLATSWRSMRPSRR